jgi:uncharacterized protein (UPF0335 family)
MIGHNSETALELSLQSFIQRIEKLVEERDTITTDIGEVYKELKGTGLDAKIVRKVIAIRKMDPADRAAEAELLGIYLAAAGM